MEENEIEETQKQNEPLFKLLSDSTSQEGASAPNAKYEDGKVLPKKLRNRFLQEAKPCVPLEEIDPYFRNKQTFIVIGRWGTVHRFSYNPDGYGTLSPNNSLRRLAVFLLTNWIFSTIIVATVLLNCVALLKTQSYEILQSLPDSTAKISWVEDCMYIVNYVCLAIYCLELLLKTVGRGLVGDGFSCFRDPWTWLDLLVIWTGFFPYYVFILHKKAAVWIRLFKIIPLIPGIRQAGKLSLKAVRRLGGMLILLVLLLWFFALLGSQVYMGTLTQKCIKNMPESGREMSDEMWNSHNANITNWYRDDYDFVQCGNASGTRQCPENYVCLQGYGKNPDGGYTNFDNVLWSLVSVIRIASEDFSEEIFRQVLETNGSWHIVFFVAIFFLITYPMGCLFFAILGHFFTESKGPAELEMEELTALADVHDFDNGSQNPESLEIKGKKLSTSEDLVGFRKTLHTFVFHDYVRNILICIILVDIIGIICDYYGVESNVFNYRLYLVVIPYTIFILYMIEFILKNIALGPLKYFRNRWNILDVVILLTFFVEAKSYFAEYNGYMLAPIRMLKLIQYWPSLRMIFAVYYKTIKTLWGWILYAFIIFAFIVAIGPFELGQFEMDRYRGKSMPRDFHRWSFIDFWHSFRVVVRMQVAEWIETFWEIYPYAGSVTFVFYLAANACGALLISFLLVGIVHSTTTELQSNYDPCKERGLRLLLRKTLGILYSPIKRIQPKELVVKSESPVENGSEEEKKTEEKDEKDENNEEDPKIKTRGRKAAMRESTNQLRKVMRDTTEHWAYQVGICAITIIASIAMVFEDKRASDGLQTGLFVIEILFTVAFAIISIFELVAYGFKESILNRGWTFDTLIVLENIINLSYYTFSVTGPFRVGMFCIRSFRPLMLICRVPWLRAPFRGLKQEVKTIWETVLAIFFIWLVFDTIGVHWLSGLFHKCLDEKGEEVRMNKQTCLANNYSWENSVFNFDNAGDGFLNMVFLVSRMGWVSIINDGSDATDKDMARERDISKLWFFYFILFVLAGGLGALGIVFSYIYNKFQEDKGYRLILTKNQATAYSDVKNSEKPRKDYVNVEEDYLPSPQSPCLRALFNFVTNRKFDGVVMALILVDNICLSLDHYMINSTFEKVLMYVRLVILALYTVEVIVKMVAWGKHYFKNAWNYLDMLVVLTGIIATILGEFVTSDHVGRFIMVAHAIRVLRLVRLFRFLLARVCGSRTAKVLITSLINIRHAFGNLLLLHIAVMWSYALLGHYLFANVLRNGVLNDVINFESFQSSLWTLILLLGFPCLDGLYVGLNNEFDCNVKDPETHNCGDKTAAILYIGSYAAITFLVLLNMYAVLISELISEIGRVRADAKSNDIPLEDVSTESARNEIPELLDDGLGKGKLDDE